MEVFRAADPALWASTGGDPLKLLSQISAERLNALARDRLFIKSLELAHADLTDYLNGERWYQHWAAEHDDAPAAIGYFSAEFGISKVLPQYSGGLGILAGDHLKAASDLGVPLIGVGLLYQHGYFIQSLDTAGWQQERYPLLSPNELPISLLTDESGEPVTIEVEVRGIVVGTQIWVARVGRVPLLLLDTNLELNAEHERLITDRLYGGSANHRLSQEIVLGIGGVRAIRAYCRVSGMAAPEIFHANEGHAVFMGLERIREYMNAGDDFDTAMERTRTGMLFTTHTPVPAGIDRFTNDQIRAQFHSFAPLPLERILGLGAETYPDGDPSRFNMAVMGLRLAQRANGVSLLHGEVSRHMFAGLWSGFDASEVPIGAVTNGVHSRSWVHPLLKEVFEAKTESSAGVVDGWDWNALDHLDDTEVWTMKRQMRGQMIAMARERLADSAANRGMSAEWVATALNPHTLTIGFARRGASYKRLTLMLSQPERLKALLNHPQTPIQIVIAGKAHPADDIGKRLIQEMVRFADQEDVRGKLVFLPDYDISLAKPLYPGCDVWLNNPLRPMEACGTSGMKAAMNGAFNLSIRDGWWDELYNPGNGWAIASAEGIADPAERDAIEAESLYQIIEHQIIPRFYQRDANGIPTEWVNMMRTTIADLGPKTMATRMVRDYVTDYYAPAARSHRQVESPGAAEELAGWKRTIRSAWPGVQITRLDSHFDDVVEVGSTSVFEVTVNLNGLHPDDVAVELVYGRVDAADELLDIAIRRFDLASHEGDQACFRLSVVAEWAGSIGYTVRALPSHRLLASRAEMSLSQMVN